jgi:CRP/FNR family transcriptional regulator
MPQLPLNVAAATIGQVPAWRHMRDEVSTAFPFFKTITAPAREALLARAIHKRLAHRQVLVSSGTECAHLPFVLSGTLRIYKMSEAGKELTLYRIERGESCILSATCILNGGSFPAIAEAEGATEVLLVPAAPMAALVESNAEWRSYIFALYAKRLDELLVLVDEVAFHHVDSRIAAYLSRHGEAGSTVQRTHAEIASELGTSREVVTRILRDFEADGIIATSRGKIDIRQPDALRDRAGPGTSPPPM